MASVCKSPGKKKGKRGKIENGMARQAPTQVERLKYRQAGTKTSRQNNKQKEFCRSVNFVGLKIGCRPLSCLSSRTPLVRIEGLEVKILRMSFERERK